MSKHVTHFSADWFSSYGERWLEILSHLREQEVAALEIGSYEGRSACWLMDNLLIHPSSTLTCIDSWDGKDIGLGEQTRTAEQAFDLNTAYYGLRINKMKARSLQALSYLVCDRDRFNLIFVDGDHEAVTALTDLLMAWTILADGGWLVFDDYQWDGVGLRAQPRDAWDAFVSVKPPDLAEVIPVGRMMFARKDCVS